MADPNRPKYETSIAACQWRVGNCCYRAVIERLVDATGGYAAPGGPRMCNAAGRSGGNPRTYLDNTRDWGPLLSAQRFTLPSVPKGSFSVVNVNVWASTELAQRPTAKTRSKQNRFIFQPSKENPRNFRTPLYGPTTELFGNGFVRRTRRTFVSSSSRTRRTSRPDAPHCGYL